MQIVIYALIGLLSMDVIAFAALILHGLAGNKDRLTRRFIATISAFAATTVISVIFCAVLLPSYWGGSNLDGLLKIITALATVLLLSIAALLILTFRGGQEKNRYFTSRNITRLAVFTAISYILYMFVKFNLPIFPFFLDFQISDMPALLAGFMMGPISGVIVIVLKVLLKLPFSSTEGVGELADLLIGIAFVLPAALIYRFNRSKKGAMISLVAGSLFCVFAAIILNRYLIVPFYVNKYFGGNLAGLTDALSALYRGITPKSFYIYYLFLGVLPFNALRCFCSALITFLVYKRTEKVFSKLFADVYSPRSSKRLKNNQAIQIANPVEINSVESNSVEGGPIEDTPTEVTPVETKNQT